jgi:hopanoid biosynthesis associated radical SAM protein HpnH
VSIPLRQVATIGGYILRQHLSGRKRYPLVLMMEPLFRCNLACAGCGKIDYPDEILNKRISVEDALHAVDECGAPVVVIAGGEPLIHKELPQIVQGIIAKRKFAIVCTNALLLEKKLKDYEPNPYFTWSIHLDGDEKMHDKSVCRKGVYDKAVSAIKAAKERGFRVTLNSTFFNDAKGEDIANFFDTVTELGVDGITVSPGYAYERAPDQKHFLNRKATKELFRDVFRRGKAGKKKWQFQQSGLFLDFLAGNQNYGCTPWGNPTRTVFGWQKPCYLLGEGYAKTFKELMEETDWDKYGVGNYEKCADCMVHSGFEASAVMDTVRRPWQALKVAVAGVRTEGAMAPDISLANQRPAEYVFSRNVAAQLETIKANNKTTKVDTDDHQDFLRSPEPGSVPSQAQSAA